MEINISSRLSSGAKTTKISNVFVGEEQIVTVQNVVSPAALHSALSGHLTADYTTWVFIIADMSKVQMPM